MVKRSAGATHSATDRLNDGSAGGDAQLGSFPEWGSGFDPKDSDMRKTASAEQMAGRK